MIVIDANVLIAHVESTDANNARAFRLLQTVQAQPLGVSPITLAEVLVRPTKVGRLAEVQPALRALRLREVSLGKYASARLALLRTETGLRMPDCCVLLAAEDCEATGILTLDDRLRAQAKRLGFDSPAE